jgi:hypothetical protein
MRVSNKGERGVKKVSQLPAIHPDRVSPLVIEIIRVTRDRHPIDTE